MAAVLVIRTGSGQLVATTFVKRSFSFVVAPQKIVTSSFAFIQAKPYKDGGQAQTSNRLKLRRFDFAPLFHLTTRCTGPADASHSFREWLSSCDSCSRPCL